MKFIGAIAFLDSVERNGDNRITNVMSFEVMVDWVKSCKEFFTQEVMTGQYDGSEVLINVYEYRGDKQPYESVLEWDYDTDNLMDTIQIRNPWY